MKSIESIRARVVDEANEVAPIKSIDFSKSDFIEAASIVAKEGINPDIGDFNKKCERYEEELSEIEDDIDEIYTNIDVISGNIESAQTLDDLNKIKSRLNTLEQSIGVKSLNEENIPKEIREKIGDNKISGPPRHSLKGKVDEKVDQLISLGDWYADPPEKADERLETLRDKLNGVSKEVSNIEQKYKQLQREFYQAQQQLGVSANARTAPTIRADPEESYTIKPSNVEINLITSMKVLGQAGSLVVKNPIVRASVVLSLCAVLVDEAKEKMSPKDSFVYWIAYNNHNKWEIDIENLTDTAVREASKEKYDIDLSRKDVENSIKELSQKKSIDIEEGGGTKTIVLRERCKSNWSKSEDDDSSNSDDQVKPESVDLSSSRPIKKTTLDGNVPVIDIQILHRLRDGNSKSVDSTIDEFKDILVASNAIERLVKNGLVDIYNKEGELKRDIESKSDISITKNQILEISGKGYIMYGRFLDQ